MKDRLNRIEKVIRYDEISDERKIIEGILNASVSDPRD